MAKLKATTVSGNLTVTGGNISGSLNAGQLNSGMVPAARLTKATTLVQGITKLNNTVDSTSSSEAATAAAVKAANDNANTRLKLDGTTTMTDGVNFNVETGKDLLKWSDATDKNFIRKLTDHGGIGISSDSSLFLHAGDYSAKIMSDAGAAADLTAENLYLMADNQITLAVNTQSSYASASKFYIRASGWHGPVVGNVNGNASTSSKWLTQRRITLGGDLTGSVGIDGSSNVTLNAKVADNSHNHTTVKALHHNGVILNDLANGNVTFSAAKSAGGTIGDLYIGYNSGSHTTKDVLLCRPMKWQSNGATIIDSNGKVPWSTLTGLPSSFTPSAHTHDDRYYTESESNNKFLYKSADSTLMGRIVTSGTDRTSGMYGTYDSYKISSIWSMGLSYKVAGTGADFGNLYGLAYKHTNNTTGGTMAGGHQMVWCSDGVGKSAIGDGVWTSGNVSANGTISGGTVLVPTRGNRNPDNGRSSFANGVYTYNTTSGSSTGAPTVHSSVLGFGRGTSGQVEICGEWTNGRGIWVRALRDTEDNWYGWTRMYTESYRPHTYGTGGPNNSDGRPDGSLYFKYI